MKFRLLMFISCFVVTASYSQGQLYLTSGDTLQGDITLLYPDDLFEEIVFEANGNKERYKAFDFLGFNLDGEEYKTIKSGQKYRIMQLVKPGYLSLYRFRIDKSYSFNGLYLYRIDGQGREVPSMLFKKTMMSFLDDCNAIEAALENNAYRKKDIERLIDDYNACIDMKTAEQSAVKAVLAEQKPVNNSPSLALAEQSLKNAEEIGDEELASMLNDVVDKLREGEEVPAYLKKAIESYVDESHALHSEITSLLSRI